MSIKNKLRSVVVNNLFSPRLRTLRRRKAELQRWASGQPHRVTAFLQIDDPYSYLLAHFLPSLANDYDIELRLRLSQAVGDEYQPAPGMAAEYAVEDCRRVAEELGVPFLDRGASPPTELRVALANAIAAGDAQLLDVLATYWRGDSEGAARKCDAGTTKGASEAAISASRAELQKLGHYNSAMLHYGGEWYWGVDRLHFLQARLDELGVHRKENTNAKLASIPQAMATTLPVRPPDKAAQLPPLEYFLSMRSPYSVISLPLVYQLADAFGLGVQVRLVMPMVMRGMQVPKLKLVYIASDTVREAELRGVPFGRLADPVGAGIERLYAAHSYARAENRERDFLLNAGVAIWADGIDVATDAGLRKVTGRTGLFWPEIKAALDSDEWRNEVEENRKLMMAVGSWGVPTMKLDDFVVWGQDRIWLLARHIEDLCESGDGILV